MSYEDLVLLIPSHSLEDFPTELPEGPATGLLNSWVVLWHPRFIASAGVVPRTHRADVPPELVANRLFGVPSKSQDVLPVGWIEKARGEGAVVLADMTDRHEMVRTALAPWPNDAALDPELVADFYALGFTFLQLELLTRHMRHFTQLDEIHFQREAVAAANAAVAHDSETCRTRLKACFEILQGARERFYPVDCYLIDICLLIPRLADDHLRRWLVDSHPFSLMLQGRDLEEIAQAKPEMVPLLKEAWQRKIVGLVGGEWTEAPTNVLPVGSILWQFEAGKVSFEEHLGNHPRIWGRRRFGLLPGLPQVLQRHGFQGALHVALDDGFYPDQEFSKVRWEGTSGTSVDALTRIPLAADPANSYLRFSVRMSESMDNDTVAAVVFARWPEVKSPFFEDLRRMQKYSPVLGRFVTLEDFFDNTDSASRLSNFDAREYLSPYYVQSVARQEPNPVTRYQQQHLRRQRFNAAAWCDGVAAALLRKTGPIAERITVENTLESAGPEGTEDQLKAAEEALTSYVPQAAQRLADLILPRNATQPGYLLINTTAFPRKTTVELPPQGISPKLEGPVQLLQKDDQHHAVTVEMPGSSFLWLTGDDKQGHTRVGSIPLAEHNLLRNDFFEVRLSESTGGIRQLKGYGRVPNRLSQQLAFRFPRERTLPQTHPDDEPVKTAYSEMRLTSSQVTCAGPTLGEIVTTGQLIDQTNGARLADFRQIFRIYRGRPLLEIEIHLDNVQDPDGEPWSNYIGVRWAWNSTIAALTRSQFGQAVGLKDDRFESPHYFEIAEESERTTILFHGLSFHRKTGERMLDTILMTAGEKARSWKFSIAIDQTYPMQAALDITTPVLVVPANGPPRTGNSGWFFHLNARNVQILDVLEVLSEPPLMSPDAWDSTPPEIALPEPGCCVRLMETEGRPVRALLKAWQVPRRARQRDFRGKTITDLILRDEGVEIDLTANEIADVELLW